MAEPSDDRPRAESLQDVQQIVQGLPEDVVQRVLNNAKVEAADARADGAWPTDSWAFTRNLPDLAELRRRAPVEGNSILQQLELSSTFACPDGTEAMLKAYGLPSRIFQGSALERDHGPAADERLAAVRTQLKADVQLAWSQEAVGRGVAHAKAGDYEAAHRCYRQALELCPGNPDALVAAGAAAANQQQLGPALEHFDAALALRPEDANAQKYRAAVLRRLDEARQRERLAERLVADAERGGQGGGPQPAAGRKSSDGARGSAGEPGSGSDSSSSGGSSSGSDDGGAPMGTAEALAIVSRHYRKRNAPQRSPADEARHDKKHKSDRSRKGKKKKKKKSKKHHKRRRV